MKHAHDLSELLLLQMFTNSRGTISLKNRSVRRHETNQTDTDATYIPVFRRWRLISLIDSSFADNCAIASSCLINSCKRDDTMQRPIVNIYSYSISPWKIEMGKEREREWEWLIQRKNSYDSKLNIILHANVRFIYIESNLLLFKRQR